MSVQTMSLAARNLLWQDDEPYARQLFEKALAFTEAKAKRKMPNYMHTFHRNLIGFSSPSATLLGQNLIRMGVRR